MRKTKFIALLTIGSLLTFGLNGCKDYDSDIAGLQTQIDALKGPIEKLPDFAKYKFVSDIQPNGQGGFTVTFTNGSTFTTETKEIAITLGVADNGYFTINGKETTVKRDELVFGEEDGYLTINGFNTGVKKGDSEPTETTIDYTDEGFLIINGVTTQVNKNALLTEDDDLTFSSEDGEFTINGKKTGVQMDGGDPGLKHEYVTATESADGKGYTFTRYDADGKKIDDFTLPKSSEGPEGIKSIVFSPQFTLDGKPAIYGQAITLDTSASGGFGIVNAAAAKNLTIYGSIAINFKLNPVTTKKAAIEKVEVYVVSLAELRSTPSNINGEGRILVRENSEDIAGRGKVDVVNGVLTVKLSHTQLDTLNKWGASAGKMNEIDKQKFLAVVLNDDVASAYIPYVSENIPSSKIFIGESRGESGYIRYGVEPKNYNVTDSINVVNYDYYGSPKFGTSEPFNPVLVYERGTISGTKRSTLPLLGFEPTWTYELLEVDGKNKDLYKEEKGVISTTKTDDAVIKQTKDSIRVKIRFSLADVLDVKTGSKQDAHPTDVVIDDWLKTCLRDSTDNPRLAGLHTNDYYNNPLVKVRAKIKLRDPKETDVVWYNGADSIHGKNPKAKVEENGVIITSSVVSLVSQNSSAVNFPNPVAPDTRIPKVFVRKKAKDEGNYLWDVNYVEKPDKDPLDKIKSGIGWTTNSIMQDSLVASAGIEAATYVASWAIDGVPGITYVAEYNVKVENPELKIYKDASYWDTFSELENTQVAPGDTVHTNMFTTSNGAPTYWVMVSVPSKGFNIDSSEPKYPLGKGTATCGIDLPIGSFAYSLPEPDATFDGTDSAVVVRPLDFGAGSGSTGNPDSVKYVVGITNKKGLTSGAVSEIGVGSAEIAKKYVTEQTPILVEVAMNFPTLIGKGPGGSTPKLPLSIVNSKDEPIKMPDYPDATNLFYLRFVNPLDITFKTLDNIRSVSPTIADQTKKLWGTNIIVSNKYESRNGNFEVDSTSSTTPERLRDKIHRYFNSVTAKKDLDDPLGSVTLVPMRPVVSNEYTGYATYSGGPLIDFDTSAGGTVTTDTTGIVKFTFVTSWGEVMGGEDNDWKYSFEVNNHKWEDHRKVKKLQLRLYLDAKPTKEPEAEDTEVWAKP